MDTAAIKELIVNGREIVLSFSNYISKLIPFPANNIAGVLVFFLCFWIISSVLNMFPNLKTNFLIKLIGSGALFYILWLW